MRDKIKEQLIAATDEIILEWQAKLHVVSGDIAPDLANMFDDELYKLACLMAVILEEQPKLGITKLTMLNGTEINLSSISLGCSETQKLAEVEKYLREREVIQ